MQAMGRLEGRRILVVGASGGIGRAGSLAAAEEGARIVLAARRPEALTQAVAEAGPACTAVECDVRDARSCEQLVEKAAKILGGLDAIVYTPGITLIVAIEDADEEAWRSTFETNLFGATLVTRAALPFLLESRGKALYISSIVIDDRPPRAGMAPYVASKVALESMAQAWQGEHPTVGFTTLAVGDTLTEKIGETSPELVNRYVPRWLAAGLMPGRLMEAESVAAQIVSVLASPENVRRIAITPMAPSKEGAAQIPNFDGESTAPARHET